MKLFMKRPPWRVGNAGRAGARPAQTIDKPRGKVESPKGFQVRPWAGPRWSNQRFEHRAFGEARRPPHVQSFLTGGAQYQIFDLTLGSRPTADPEAQRASGLVYVRNAFSRSKRLRLQGGNPCGIPGLAKGQTATARIEDSRRGTGRKMNSRQSENTCTRREAKGFTVWPLARLAWLNQRFRQATAVREFSQFPPR